MESDSVMIFRAAIFIGLVAILMPHEPDLGLGRPQTGALLSWPFALSAGGLSGTGQACDRCAGDSATISSMPSISNGRSLADIRAEIETAIEARRARV